MSNRKQGLFFSGMTDLQTNLIARRVESVLINSTVYISTAYPRFEILYINDRRSSTVRTNRSIDYILYIYLCNAAILEWNPRKNFPSRIGISTDGPELRACVGKRTTKTYLFFFSNLSNSTSSLILGSFVALLVGCFFSWLASECIVAGWQRRAKAVVVPSAYAMELQWVSRWHRWYC